VIALTSRTPEYEHSLRGCGQLEAGACFYAAIHNDRLDLSVPAQSTHLFHAGLIGPHGEVLADAGDEPGLVVATLDREEPALHVALDRARPWRATAREGEIYEMRRVSDVRSRVRTKFQADSAMFANAVSSA
jgi:hypothetical protein